MNCTDDGGPAEVDEIHDNLDEKAECSAQVGVEYSGASIWARGIGITSVEAVPSDSENTGTDKHE